VKPKQTEKPGANEVSYKKGEIILKEGDHSSIVYFLNSGTIGIYKGKERVNKLSGQGLLFGEMSSILNEPRSTTVKAETDCKVQVYQGGVQGIIKRFPHVAEKILGQLAMRIDTMNENFKQLQEQYNRLQEDYSSIKKELQRAREEFSKLDSPQKSQEKNAEQQKAPEPEKKREVDKYVDSGFILDYPSKRKISSKDD